MTSGLDKEPVWMDRSLYPFASRFLDVPDGRMHYIDEGQGEPVVFVHGVPTWSFNYRHLIRELAPSYRCVAMDHLGFGLSDKPRLGSGVPQTLAENVKRLIHRLELRNVTLVVHDWGGPIGLAYAIDEPQNVRRLVMFNTWLWGANVDLRTAVVTRLLASPVYRFLEDRMNFTARMFIPQVMADRRVLTKEVHRHYTEPLRRRGDRCIQWELIRGILHEAAWIEGLRARRDVLQSIPTLILWGMKDKAFSTRDLIRLRHALPHAIAHEIGEAGHFPQEEVPDMVDAFIKDFLTSTTYPFLQGRTPNDPCTALACGAGGSAACSTGDPVGDKPLDAVAGGPGVAAGLPAPVRGRLSLANGAGPPSRYRATCLCSRTAGTSTHT